MRRPAGDGDTVVLSARRISKSFNGVQVLFSVNFDLRPAKSMP